MVCQGADGQNYNAYGYWKMERDSLYQLLKNKKISGEMLSASDSGYISTHKARMDEYFDKMPDNEKSLYFKYRTNWDKMPVNGYSVPPAQQQEIFMGEKSTFTRYIISSGFFGLYYGIAAVAVFDIKDENAAAIPLLTAGASVLVPLLSVNQDKATYNSLKLSQHGKLAGMMHGAALGLIFSGKDDTDGKLITGLSAAGSIGCGWLGYKIGQNYPMTPGNASLYAYYGTLIPFEAVAVDGLFQVNDQAVGGLSILAGGAAGYLLASQVSKRYSFTPGDLTSTRAFCYLNVLLGLGILADINENSNSGSPSLTYLVPVATTLGGSFISHIWLKDAKLTSQQGRNTALAAGAGAILGYGAATLFKSDSQTPRYLIPYLSGLGSYAIMLHICKSLGQTKNLTENDNRFKINFLPQNILLNQRFGKLNSKSTGMLPNSIPVVTASYNF